MLCADLKYSYRSRNQNIYLAIGGEVPRYLYGDIFIVLILESILPCVWLDAIYSFSPTLCVLISLSVCDTNSVEEAFKSPKHHVAGFVV